MKILVAPDSFGGTLSAVEAAEAVAAGWRRYAPDDEILVRPLSDGGPGFVDVLASVLSGRLLPVTVPDPFGRQVPARVFRVGDTAFVESAQATGLHLLDPAERDPLRATSYGVGVMITAAVETGARRVVVGLGGSATNDAGAGMLAALGVAPLDAGGAALPYGGAALVALDRLEGTPRLRGVELVAASDVDNPLVGQHGASAVFGPQKGAGVDDVALLDVALARWAQVTERDLPGVPAGLALLAGGGAAGGLGAALLALGARRESGIELVRQAVGLDAAVDNADLVLTGEGSFDAQSLRGKVAAGVARAAAHHGRPCLVLAGQVSVDESELVASGVRAAYSVAEHAGSVQAAMAAPAERLADLAARVASDWGHRR
ncbi:MAG TPA: glycerate kinase [Mycobacteriales bacterium]